MVTFNNNSLNIHSTGNSNVQKQTIAELHYKDACDFATANSEDLTSGYTENDANQTITKDNNDVVTIDGQTLAVNHRILVKNQTDTTENGIYKVTQLGNGSSTPLILTRAEDFNIASECPAGGVSFVIVSKGTENASKSFIIGTGEQEAETTFGTTTFSVSTGAAAASEITVADESSDAECFPVFTTDATGNRAPKTGTNLTFNSSSGALTATTFLGTASNATKLNTTTNAVVKTTGGDGTLDLGGLVSGDIPHNAANTSGSSDSCTGTAAIATSITATANDDADETVYLTFVDGATGTQGIETDTGLTYNPSTGRVTAVDLYGRVVRADQTAITSLRNNSLIVGGNTQNNYIDFATDDMILFDTDDTERFRVDAAGVDVTGALTATGDITAFSSDKRLKKDIEIIESPLEKIQKLSGFTYLWNKDKCENAGFKSNNEKQIGVFAQDVQEVIPEAVKIAPFDRDDDGNSKSGENYLTVQYEKIIPLLIESIKEQQKQIEELRNEVELLKNK